MPGYITRRSVSTRTTVVSASTRTAASISTSTTTTQLFAEASNDTPNRRSKRQRDDDNDEVAAVTPSPHKKRRSARGETAQESAPIAVSVKKTTAKKKAGAKKKKTTKTSPASHTPPDNWQDIYSLVQELRQDRTAPCDGEGAEALPEPNLDPKTFRFQTLIALMLSSQTKDAMVGQAMRKLQAHGLTVDNLHPDVTSPETLKELIYGVGFHNNKTKYIHQVVLILLEKYDGDIPPTAAEMIKELPGVGPKMAYIIENICWDTQSGIGVDTHMHRLFPLIGYVKRDVKNPEQTRLQLESWLPTEYWKDANLLFVGFGQEVQQYKPKILRKALDCSRKYEALRLLQKVGMNIRKEADANGWREELDQILKAGKN